MDAQLIWIVAVFGALALGGVFWKMKPGFGPYNLRAIGIILVAVFATLLSMRGEQPPTAAMGILGAIAGYLFGIKDGQKE